MRKPRIKIDKKDEEKQEVSDKKIHQLTSEEIKSFDQKAKDILNYLDSIGENIYDPDRYPGMYLRRDKNIMPKSLKNIFDKNTDISDKKQEPDLSKLFKK